MNKYLPDNCFIIAEIGASHHQDFMTACNLVDAAIYAGADAVKVQMFKPSSLASRDDAVLDDGPWAGHSLWELYEKASMPYEWVPTLKDQTEKAGLRFIASVYETKTLDVAESMDIEAYKVASYEAGEKDLLKALAKTGKPVIVSTGVLSWQQIREVAHILPRVALLKCTSEYPAPLEEMNLRTLLDMKRNFGPYIGLSDHTDGIVAPVTAVAMGARIIEKHIKIDEQGLDSLFAINPEKFRVMVDTIRAAEKCMGKVSYGGTSNIKRKMVNGKSARIVEKDVEKCSLTK
jgi:pseudaminic acid synthase